MKVTGAAEFHTATSPYKNMPGPCTYDPVPTGPSSVPRLAVGSGVDPRPPVEAVPAKRRKLSAVAEPWDKLRGDQFDVFAERRRLEHILENTAAVHWAPNCGTFSQARRKPIPGVKHPPVPLRDEEHPYGLPYLSGSRWKSTKARVDRDTKMAVMAARDCLSRHRKGLPFSLEHPANSIARSLDEWKELEAEPGVYKVFHHHCMFDPCKKRKYEIVVTNIPTLQTKIGRRCEDSRVCPRTGLPHEEFKAVVKEGKVEQFGTTGTAEYPEELCIEQAAAMLEHVITKNLFDFEYCFLEVFCGKNAPLTRQANLFRDQFNEQAEGCRTISSAHGMQKHQEGIYIEDLPPQPASSSREAAGDRQPPSMQPISVFQSSSRATGRQPKWNSSFQLIEDGLEDPQEHMRRALALEHPGQEEGDPN